MKAGLDVDFWYSPAPGHAMDATEREQFGAMNVVDAATLTASKTAWSEAHAKLLKRAASYPEVARIFVHPAVKKALCEWAGEDRAWLQKVRPWFKHDDHFHVRLNCPPGNTACVAQAATAADDGCGKELDDWFQRLRAKPKKPTKPSAPIQAHAGFGSSRTVPSAAGRNRAGVESYGAFRQAMRGWSIAIPAPQRLKPARRGELQLDRRFEQNPALRRPAAHKNRNAIEFVLL